MVKHDPWLNSCDATVRIDLQDVSHVLREVEDHRDVAALSGEGSAPATAKERGAEFAANTDCRENVVSIARQNDANGNLAIVRAVCRVEGAAAVVELYVAANTSAQGFVQPQRIGY